MIVGKKASKYLILLLAVVCWVSAPNAYAACSGPAGVAGNMGFNETGGGDYEYCNGTDWISMDVADVGTTFDQVISITNGTGCSIKTDGTAWCWGSDSKGQLGNGATTGNQPDPVQVSDAGPWQAIDTGSSHTCGIKSDGTAWCWGEDDSGQLGNGATTGQQDDPVQVSDAGPWQAIDAGGAYTCGIKTDGTAWCWGSDFRGQLGNGATTGNQPDPVQVSDAGPWQAISTSKDANSTHTCGIKSDGTAWCWGQDGAGQLGNGATTGQQDDPVQVSDAGPWQAISLEGAISCGIKTDGSGWCWGNDGFGELGNGATTGDQPDPVQISDAGPWQAISANSFFGCGIKTDGTAWCWGDDRTGQLGNGATTGQQDDPVQVSDAGPWAAIATGHKAVSITSPCCGISHNLTSCGIKTDGTAWCWGSDSDSGQLGNGGAVTADQPDPYQVSDAGPWATPGGGGGGTCSKAGEMYYDTAINNIVWCDGAALKRVANADGAGGAGCSTPTAAAGAMEYDTGLNKYRFCDGTNWAPIPPPDSTPDAFSFTDLTNQALGAQVTSNIVQITGIDDGAVISIAGGGGDYQICNDSGCGTVNHPWSTSAGTIDDGEYVQLRMTTSGSYLTMVSTTLTVGTFSNQWDVTTLPPPEKKVFVTSTTYNGNLGGTFGAASSCAARATAASLPGTFKAWVAGSVGDDPATTFTQASVAYKLTNGTTVANNWADLTDGTLAAAIDRDEFGNVQSGNVWSNADSSGNRVGNTNCSDWVISAGGSNRGLAGSATATDATWADTTNPQCNSTLRLYCFEQ